MRLSRRKILFPSNDGRTKLKKVLHAHRQKPGHNRMTATEASFFPVPRHFSTTPIIKDLLVTKTSIDQDETVRECLPLLKCLDDPTRDPFDFNGNGVPPLDREEHVVYLQNALEEFPAAFVGADASRPWMVYWGLMGLYLLGEDVTEYRSRVVKSFTTMQNLTGGFGGGQGQYSHLAGSYAAILSLALVGGPDTFSFIDRRSMWQWLGRLKQPNGGFRICEGGEEDVRGAYCALVMLSLLDLPFELDSEAPARQVGLQTFGDGLGEYLSRCQTYEGGISAAPGNEAHGAYAFCTIACLCLLDEPHKAIPRYLDVEALLSWLSSRQYAPEGGFAGRTNKLVDACYSHWLGGCWPLVQAALDGPYSNPQAHGAATVGSLYSREGLTRYTLCCCQSATGGLRDKPSKSPDSYHTCYNLAGLSALQHYHYYESPLSAAHFATAFTWRVVDHQPTTSRSLDVDVFDDADRLRPFHPVYVIPHASVLAIRAWAEAQHRL